MAQSWVVCHRSPPSYSSFVALRPVRHGDKVIRLHPFAGKLMDADHDGARVSVFLPLGQPAQKEAAEKLSIAAHARRDWTSFGVGFHDANFGLALLSLSEAGRKELEDLAGAPLADAREIFTSRRLKTVI